MRLHTTRFSFSLSAALALLFLLAVFAVEAQAVTIQWSTVGNPGNVPDTVDGNPQASGIQRFGGVPYAYRIGTTEVTNAQYAEFLNSVAASDTYALYNSSMGSDVVGGITRSGSSGSYSYSVKPGYGNLPVNYVSWGDSARFANWLSNSQPTGGENLSTTENGSYYLNGAVSDSALAAITRSSSAIVVVPTNDEWYKAAYYNPATSTYFKYPTSSNTLPSNSFVDAGNNANFYNGTSYTTGSPYLTEVGHFGTSKSPYGTFDQGGNVFEWTETFTDGSFRVARGGAFSSFLSSFYLSSSIFIGINEGGQLNGVGFRVASLDVLVPEPSSFILAGLGIVGLLLAARRRQRARSA